jgi:hypothetical protein
MRVTKCDLCRKKITGEPVTVGVGYFPRNELCEKCGRPIIGFLKKHKFIDQKDKNKK